MAMMVRVGDFPPDHSMKFLQKYAKSEILRTRQAMWSAVSSRKHTPVKIFPFGNGAHEYMLYGVVQYLFKAGEQAEVDWAARVVLAEVNGIWKMKYYQVYLVSFCQGATLPFLRPVLTKKQDTAAVTREQ